MNANLGGLSRPARNGTQKIIYIQIGRCGIAVVVVTLKNTVRNVYVICEYVRLDVRAQHMCICVPLIKESEVMTHACHTPPSPIDGVIVTRAISVDREGFMYVE